MDNTKAYTDRQKREVEYHRAYAESHKGILEKSFSFEVTLSKKRRWWNANWEMYTYLLSKQLNGKNLLVIGCGFGDDALKLAKAGANVKAFDLSPECLFIARKLADREELKIDFQELPAEKLDYDNDYFDIVVARDIMDHVEISESIGEILRTSKPGAIFCFNEIYSHSFTEKIRNSKFVDKWLYPKMQNFVYKGEKPYITEDERKLTEKEVSQLLTSVREIEIKKYFNFLVTRVIPKKYKFCNKLDRLILIILSPISHILGGRVLIGGVLNK